MAADDADLLLIDSFRLAYGAALAGMGRSGEALEALSAPGLAVNAEACAWRMTALAREKFHAQALQQIACAQPAIAARAGPRRLPLLLIAAETALKAGRPDLTLRWLQPVKAKSAAADLLRARAHLARNELQPAQVALARAEKSRRLDQQLDAELGGIEIALRNKTLPATQALKKLRQISYAWRGGETEERALRLSYRLSAESGDLRGALVAGSTLFRYFELGPEAGTLMRDLQLRLAAAVDPASGLPLDQALGLYWDHRDLTPLGAEGDLMVARLGDRLQEAGLYARATDLFEHQLFARARDLAQGPLSAKVARLHILAGQPERALEAIRRTTEVRYPANMLWEREQVAAVALSQLGRTEEALAVLDTVPGSAALKGEILWKKRDWNALAATIAPSLPPADGMSEVGQAKVLRYAVALAMMRREPELQALGARYGEAFAGLPSGPAFEALTGIATGVDGDALSRALASIPSASPAGDLADLLEISPAKATARGS